MNESLGLGILFVRVVKNITLKMSEFRTVVDIHEFPWKITYDKQAMMMGSCFSEHMGSRLQRLRFKVDLNPFGILYNPESIAMGLELLLNKRTFSKDDLFFYQGKWNSFSHHGRFSSADPEEALAKMNERIVKSSEVLRKADFLFLTFGTSWIYRNVESGEVVANCHKVPAKAFNRTRLSVLQIVRRYKDLLERIWVENPNLKVIFSVSPIRHWKDGAVENQISKSTLLLAIHQLKEEFGENRLGYFPSYEILMDDLRDYRFYEADMLHPSKVAVDYVWSKFTNAAIHKGSEEVIKKVEKIVLGLEHRTYDEHSENYQKFLWNLRSSCEKLMADYGILALNELLNDIDTRIGKSDNKYHKN